MTPMRALRALALVLCAAPALAEDQPPEGLLDRIETCIGRIDAPADHADLCMGMHALPCMAKPENETTVGMVTCLTQETTAWSVLLDRELSLLVAKLDVEQRAAFDKAQAAWSAWRDADCVFPHVLVRGSLAQPWSSDCYMQHTARRALELREYLAYLET
ncbi:MAG: lysozyme inhibitor LprI family protein [Pseudomonadota bacterium]